MTGARRRCEIPESVVRSPWTPPGVRDAGPATRRGNPRTEALRGAVGRSLGLFPPQSAPATSPLDTKQASSTPPSTSTSSQEEWLDRNSTGRAAGSWVAGVPTTCTRNPIKRQSVAW